MWAGIADRSRTHMLLRYVVVCQEDIAPYLKMGKDDVNQKMIKELAEGRCINI